MAPALTETADPELGQKKKKRSRGHEPEPIADPAPGDEQTVKQKKKKRKHTAPDAEPPPVAQPEPALTEEPDAGDAARKKKKRKKDKHTTAASDTSAQATESLAARPYTDVTTFISSLGNQMLHEPGNVASSSAIQVVQNFGSQQIAAALQNLQHATRVTPIGIPVVGAHPARPLSAQQRPRSSPPGSQRDTPAPNSQKAPSVTTITAQHQQAVAPHANAEEWDPILSEKWLPAVQLNELAKSQGLKFKKGKFSVIEDEQIDHAIENYRVKNGLEESDIEEIIFGGAKSKGGKSNDFFSFVTAAVPGRPIISVYQHVRRIRNPLRQSEGGTGAWTAEQDAQLIQAVTQFGPSWEKVSKIVLRAPADCRDRHRNHLSDVERNRNRGKWTKEEEDDLIRIVTEMLAAPGRQPGDEIFWTRVSEKMSGRRGKQQCRDKWNDRLSKRVRNLEDRRWCQYDTYILISKVDALDIRHDTEINWKTIPDEDWDVFNAHQLQTRWHALKRTITGWPDKSHAEIMDILREKRGSKPPAMPSAVESGSNFVSAEFVDPNLEDDGQELEAALNAALQELQEPPALPPTDATLVDDSQTKKKKKRKERKSHKDLSAINPQASAAAEEECAARAGETKKKKKKRTQPGGGASDTRDQESEQSRKKHRKSTADE